MTKAEQMNKVLEFVSRGPEIFKKEHHATAPIPYTGGPLFEKWINEIKLFNERYLKDHPLHSDIFNTYFHHKTQSKSYQIMMGHLEALASDTEYWQTASTPAIIAQTTLHLERGENTMEPIIFISHRSIDAQVAELLRDYLVSTGIPTNYIFCSSLPGNDVEQIISREVKEKIANSTVNIAILSNAYYESSYCLNEAGIIWLQEPHIPAIVVGLPEITHTNMLGFLNSDYKLRRLDNATDISAIYDTVQKAVGAPQASLTVATAASQRLSDRYTEYLATRTLPSEQAKHETPSTSLLAETTTDDERVVLYYILTNKVKRVQKSDIQAWMTDHEIYNVNVENAFDLLASLGAGTYENETLNMDIATFRKYTSSTDELIPMLKSVVESHQMLSSERFLTMWANGSFTDEAKLFVAYIIQNRVTTLGARWMAQGVEDSIHQWELNNCLDISVSSTYSTHLNQFIDNHFVYESSWTSYGNAREYTLCSSLRRLLLEADFPYAAEIVTVMEAHKEIFPF